MAGARTTRGGDRDHTPEPVPGASPERLPRPRSLAAGTGQMAARSGAQAEEDSGLIDIRNMARHTRRRVSDRMSSQSEVEESLLASSRPSALRDVVLPEPGKEQPMPSVSAAMAGEAGAGLAGAAPDVALDAPPRRKGGLFAVVAVAVLGAGGAAAWYATQGGTAQGADDAIASAPVGQGAAGAGGIEPPAADDSVEPGGVVPPEDDDSVEPGGVVPPEDDDSVEPGGVVPPKDEVAAAGDVEAAGETGVADEAELAAAAPAEEPETRVARAAREREEPKAARSRGRDRADRGRRAEAKQQVARGEPANAEARAEPPPAKADLDALLDHAAGGAHRPDKQEAAPEAPSKTSLSRGDIKAGMKTIKARVGACYQSHKAPGVVQVKVTIAPTGVVTSADTVDGKFRGTDTGVCVANAVRAAEFPAWSGAPMTVTFPFLLQ